MHVLITTCNRCTRHWSAIFQARLRCSWTQLLHGYFMHVKPRNVLPCVQIHQQDGKFRKITLQAEKTLRMDVTWSLLRRTTCCHTFRSSSILTGLIRKSTAPCVTPRRTTLVSPFDDITAFMKTCCPRLACRREASMDHRWLGNSTIHNIVF